MRNDCARAGVDGMDAQVVFPIRPDPSRYGLTPARLQFFRRKTDYSEEIFFVTIGSVLLIPLGLKAVSSTPSPSLALALLALIVIVMAKSGRISKVIYRFKLRSIAAQPDYPQFLKYSADLVEH